MVRLGKNVKVRGNINRQHDYIGNIFHCSEIHDYHQPKAVYSNCCNPIKVDTAFELRTVNRRLHKLAMKLDELFKDGKNKQRLKAAAHISLLYGCTFSYVDWLRDGSFLFTTTRSGRECAVIDDEDEEIAIYVDSLEFVPIEDDMAYFDGNSWGLMRNDKDIFEFVCLSDYDTTIGALGIDRELAYEVYYCCRNYYVRPWHSRYSDFIEDCEDICEYLDGKSIPYTIFENPKLVRIDIDVKPYVAGSEN